MSGLTVLLAYAGWAAGPLVAYAALSHGLARKGRGFLLLFAGYSAVVWLTWGADGSVPVLAPWGGIAVLSALLYGLGARIGGGT